LKREEILEKIKKAEFLAGKIINKEKDKQVGIFNDRRILEKAEKELNTEFIPDLYDKTMEAIFEFLIQLDDILSCKIKHSIVIFLMIYFSLNGCPRAINIKTNIS
jgi:type III secretion system FlhB-like substrate exporter